MTRTFMKESTAGYWVGGGSTEVNLQGGRKRVRGRRRRYMQREWMEGVREEGERERGLVTYIRER